MPSQQTVRCKQCGSLVELVVQPLGLAPHVCASVRAREELERELRRANDEVLQAKTRADNIKQQLQRAEEAERVEAAETRAREWLEYLVDCLQPGASAKGFLRNFHDEGPSSRTDEASRSTEFTYVLPSGHTVTLAVRPGRQRPPTAKPWQL